VTEYLAARSDSYLRLLEQSYKEVWLIEPDGALSAVPDWGSLARLASGKGWEDLLCVPARIGRMRQFVRRWPRPRF
jgi:hypothetical protein